MKRIASLIGIFASYFFIALLGICAGVLFTIQNWSPLLWDTPHNDMSFRHIAEPDKRAFFQTLYETYESDNPMTEKFDYVGIPPRDADLRLHNERFDQLLKQVPAKGCRTRQVTVPTRYQNMDAVDRVFQVFDVQQCQ